VASRDGEKRKLYKKEVERVLSWEKTLSDPMEEKGSYLKNIHNVRNKPSSEGKNVELGSPIAESKNEANVTGTERLNHEEKTKKRMHQPATAGEWAT